MVLSSLERDESPNHMENLEEGNWSANFAMDDEHENERMEKAVNELATLISSLNLESEIMPIEEYMQLARK